MGGSALSVGDGGDVWQVGEVGFQVAVGTIPIPSHFVYWVHLCVSSLRCCSTEPGLIFPVPLGLFSS